MTNRDKAAKVKAKIAALRGAAGAERRSYFAAGLSLAGWRGQHKVQQDRKAEGSRKACRGRVLAD